mmetsp:Transcript_39669/g.38243  ORF Transcript_39669/g.38243 Transcript_39669/m.38243 type:complete len:104 (+) Transcript_39669:823-1134(+)
MENQPSSVYPSSRDDSRITSAEKGFKISLNKENSIESQEEELEQVMCFDCKGTGLMVQSSMLESRSCLTCLGSGRISNLKVRDLVKLIKSDNMGVFEPILLKY